MAVYIANTGKNASGHGGRVATRVNGPELLTHDATRAAMVGVTMLGHKGVTMLGHNFVFAHGSLKNSLSNRVIGIPIVHFSIHLRNNPWP